MPRIVVLAKLEGGREEQTFTEHVRAAELESEYFVGQIVERLGWGLADGPPIAHLEGHIVFTGDRAPGL